MNQMKPNQANVEFNREQKLAFKATSSLIKEYWLRRRPKGSPAHHPQVDEVNMMWGYRLRSLPLSSGVGLGTMYASRQIRKKLQRTGQVGLQQSNQFVAARRLKRGDLVGVTCRFSHPYHHRRWRSYLRHSRLIRAKSMWGIQTGSRRSHSGQRNYMEYRSRSSIGMDEEMPLSPFNLNLGHSKRMKKLHLGIPMGNPRRYPHLRDYYDIYRGVGSSSQRTLNLILSGMLGNHPKEMKQTRSFLLTRFQRAHLAHYQDDLV